MALTLIPGVGAFLFLLIWVLILSYPIPIPFTLVFYWLFFECFVERLYAWCGRVLFTISINFSQIRHFLRVGFRKLGPLLKIELFVVAS